MSETLKKTWDFTQKGYIQKHGLGDIGGSSEGICISLSCRWAKLMLKSEKDLFGSPELTQGKRSTYFAKGSVPKRIAINQDIYDKEREAARNELTNVKASKKLADELFNNGEISWEDHKILSGQIIDGAREAVVVGAGANSVQKILLSNKLQIVETRSCNSFAEFFLGTQPKACYVFQSSGLEHAFGGYVTGGVFSKEYYFFDPNSGEFIASGDSGIAVVMQKFADHYTKQGHPNSKTDRHRVEYGK